MIERAGDQFDPEPGARLLDVTNLDTVSAAHELHARLIEEVVRMRKPQHLISGRAAFCNRTNRHESLPGTSWEHDNTTSLGLVGRFEPDAERWSFSSASA